MKLNAKKTLASVLYLSLTGSFFFSLAAGLTGCRLLGGDFGLGGGDGGVGGRLSPEPSSCPVPAALPE